MGEVLAGAVVALDRIAVRHVYRLKSTLAGMSAEPHARNDAALGGAVDRAIVLGDAEEFWWTRTLIFNQTTFNRIGKNCRSLIGPAHLGGALPASLHLSLEFRTDCALGLLGGCFRFHRSLLYRFCDLRGESPELAPGCGVVLH